MSTLELAKKVLNNVKDMNRRHLFDTDQLQKLSSQNEELLEKQRQLDDKIFQMKSAMSRMNETMEQKQESILGMQESIDMMESAENKAESAELSKMKLNLTTKEATLERLRQEKTELESRVQELQHKNESLRRDHEKTLQTLKEEHAQALKAKEQAILEIRESLKLQSGASGSQLAATKQDLESSKIEVGRLEAQLGSEQEEFERLLEKEKQRTLQQRNLNEELVNERKEAEQSLQALEKQMQETQVDRYELEESRNRITTLQGELQRRQREHEEALADHAAKMDEHAEQVAQLQKRIEKLENDLEKCLFRHKLREKQDNEKIRAELVKKQQRALKKMGSTLTEGSTKPATEKRVSRRRRPPTSGPGPKGPTMIKKGPEPVPKPKLSLLTQGLIGPDMAKIFGANRFSANFKTIQKQLDKLKKKIIFDRNSGQSYKDQIKGLTIKIRDIERDMKDGKASRINNMNIAIRKVKEDQAKFFERINKKDATKKKLVEISNLAFDKMMIEKLINRADKIFNTDVIEGVKKQKMRSSFGKNLKADFLKIIGGVKSRKVFIMLLKEVTDIKEKMFQNIAYAASDESTFVGPFQDRTPEKSVKDLSQPLPGLPGRDEPEFQIQLRF